MIIKHLGQSILHIVELCYDPVNVLELTCVQHICDNTDLPLSTCSLLEDEPSYLFSWFFTIAEHLKKKLAYRQFSQYWTKTQR